MQPMQLHEQNPKHSMPGSPLESDYQEKEGAKEEGMSLGDSTEAKELSNDSPNDLGNSSKETPKVIDSSTSENDDAILQSKHSQINQSIQSGPQARKSSALKHFKKRNIFITSGIALILLLIGAYMMADKMNSPAELVKEFEEAMQEKDTETLMSILTTDHDDLEINEDTVEAFIKLYDEHPTEFRHMMTQLKAQAEGAAPGYSMYPIELEKRGKSFFYFDNYRLVLLPVYINVTTTCEDTDIYVNGEKMGTADEEYFQGEIGPVIPGIHTVKAVYDTGFFHLDKEVEVAAGDPNYAEFVDLYLEGDNVSFNLITNRYDQLNSIKLYINGKETDYDLVQESRVGPLLTDGSMNASFEAEFPWGTMMTNEVPIDSSYIDFNFGDSEEFRREIMDVIITFNEELIEVYTTADPAVLTTSALPLQEAIMEEVTLIQEEDIVYEGAFHGLDFYLESFKLQKSYDDLWKVDVDTIGYFEEDIFLAGDNANLEQVEEELKYELVYEPQLKEWVVINLGYAGTMDTEKMERYKVDDPVVHTSEWNKK